MDASTLAQRVLNFWFSENRWNNEGPPPTLHSPVPSENQEQWFKSNKEFDAQICLQFEHELVLVRDDHYRSLYASTADVLSHPEYTLACIIVLDQFPRNIYRGEGRAFAFDEKAKELSELLISHGADKQLPYLERVFVNLPFSHSELIDDQDKNILYSQTLVDEAKQNPATSSDVLEILETIARYGIIHRDIIVQFGRYPHRNAALKRESSPAEETFINEGGHRFGQ